MASSSSIRLPSIKSLAKGMDKKTAASYANFKDSYPCVYPLVFIALAYSLKEPVSEPIKGDPARHYAARLVARIRKISGNAETNCDYTDTIIRELLTGKRTKPFDRWAFRSKTSLSYFVALAVARHVGELCKIKNLDNHDVLLQLARRVFTPATSLKKRDYGVEPSNAVYRSPAVYHLAKQESPEIQAHFFALKAFFPNAVHDAVLLLLARCTTRQVSPIERGAGDLANKMMEKYPVAPKHPSAFIREIGLVLEDHASYRSHWPNIFYLGPLLDLEFPGHFFARELYRSLQQGPHVRWWEPDATPARPYRPRKKLRSESTAAAFI